MGKSSQMKAIFKQTIKLKADKTNTPKTCKCKERRACFSQAVSAGSCLLKREVLYQAVSQKYCTSCSTPCHKHRVRRGRGEREHWTFNYSHRSRGKLFQGGSGGRKALAGHKKIFYMQDWGNVCNICCLLATEPYTFLHNTLIHPQFCQNLPSKDSSDSFRVHSPSRSNLIQGFLQTSQISEHEAAHRL